MTTLTFTGTRLTWANNDERVTSVAPTTLKMVVSDSYRVGYRYDSGTSVDLSPEVGMDYSVRVGGKGFGDNADAEIFSITSGGKTGVIMVLHPNDSQMGYEHVFQISGPAFDLSTVAKTNAFMNAITAQTRVAGSNAFGPGKALDMTKFDAFASSAENDVLIADARYDDWRGMTVYTGKGNDRVQGLGYAERIDLGIGNDSAKGLAGNDSLLGGTGNDTLSGGAGNDVMAGGTGRDVFIYSTGSDRVTDFSEGQDRLNLSAVVAITDLDDMTQNHIRTRNGNVIIDLHNGNSITLLGVTEGDLHQAGYASHFIF